MCPFHSRPKPNKPSPMSSLSAHFCHHMESEGLPMQATSFRPLFPHQLSFNVSAMQVQKLENPHRLQMRNIALIFSPFLTTTSIRESSTCQLQKRSPCGFCYSPRKTHRLRCHAGRRSRDHAVVPIACDNVGLVLRQWLRVMGRGDLPTAVYSS